MAGGLDLIDRMKAGEVFDSIVSLSGIPQLKEIASYDNTVTLGALTTHAALTEHPLIRARFPDLAKLWHEIANARVRQTGTIGGNLVSGLPHYDTMPALLALGATATVANKASGMRTVSLSELTGAKVLLVNVIVPESSTRLLADRSLHPSVAVYIGANVMSGVVKEIRVAVGGAYSRPAVVFLPVSGLDQAALGEEAATFAQTVVNALPEPLSDGVASAGYRRRMIAVLTRRLLVRLGALT